MHIFYVMIEKIKINTMSKYMSNLLTKIMSELQLEVRTVCSGAVTQPGILTPGACNHNVHSNVKTVIEFPFFWLNNIKFVKCKISNLLIENIHFAAPWTITSGMAARISPFILATPLLRKIFGPKEEEATEG